MVESHKVATLVAPKATDIDITAAATLTINAIRAATIDVEGAFLTGDLSITACTTIVR